MTKCPVCLVSWAPGEYLRLSEHFVERASDSDPGHVRWLNQNVSRSRLPAPELVPKLRKSFELGPGGLAGWVRARFIARFYGPVPHPFVVALQHPTRAVLLGYVIEHQHFLRQWVRSCAYIMARTDQPRVVLYELDNLNTEFGGSGPDHPSHYELLLRMGEGLGMSRGDVLATEALPATRRGIEGWERIAAHEPWVAALAAMHALELIADRDLVREGASVHYFDPAILEGEGIPSSAQAFLREGYEADIGHSSQALALVEEFATDPGSIEDVQATFLRSIDLFDDYLLARLERGIRLEA